MKIKINLPHLLCLFLLAFSKAVFAQNLTPAELLSCKQQINQKLYYSERTQTGFDSDALEISNTEYAKNLGELFDYLPEIQKKVFCNVDRIQIHEELRAVAYASVILDRNRRPVGNVIGIKVQALSSSEDFDIFTWKEQLSFGLSKKDDPYFTTSPYGPQVKINMAKVQRPELFYVLVHEINHLIDFMNNVTSFDCRNSIKQSGYNCQFTQDSFALFSFPLSFEVKKGGEFIFNLEGRYPLLSQFCFYDCQKFINPASVKTFYKSLVDSNFVSTYSVTHMSEDFAEFATVHLLNTLNLKYELKIYDEKNEILYDQNKSFFNPLNQKMRIKRQWVQNFFNQNSIKYRW